MSSYNYTSHTSVYKKGQNKAPYKVSVPKVFTAALAGIAGGIAITSSFPFVVAAGITGVIGGGFLGGFVTGVSEYKRERKKQNLEIDCANEKW
jgi:hypothetical protein